MRRARIETLINVSGLRGFNGCARRMRRARIETLINVSGLRGFNGWARRMRGAGVETSVVRVRRTLRNVAPGACVGRGLKLPLRHSDTDAGVVAPGACVGRGLKQ